MERVLAGLGVEVEIAPSPVKIEVPETESSFMGNTLLKARAYSLALGAPALADDSGLCVYALGGMPGVLSARWAGVAADEQERDVLNVALLLDQLGGLPGQSRHAKFVCAVALVLPDGSEFCDEGEMFGSVAAAPIGENGFGYDPIFLPQGFEVTTAQMTKQEKDAISHRGRALASLVARGVFS